MKLSRFSMGMASSRSSALPCGTPSTMSISTTSASSLLAIQWAAVAPTFPEPTIETFLRMNSPQVKLQECVWPLSRRKLCLVHVADDGGPELACLYLLRAFHLAGKVIGHDLL